jgi:hypothetical protein
MGLLEKYRKQSWLARNFDDLEADLEKGMHSGEIPPWFLIRTFCTDCDEECLAIRHQGKRHLVHEVSGRLTLHQCPQPVDQRQDDWTDDQDRRHDQFPDDPYNYPDIPYVDPTQGNR